MSSNKPLHSIIISASRFLCLLQSTLPVESEIYFEAIQGFGINPDRLQATAFNAGFLSSSSRYIGFNNDNKQPTFTFLENNLLLQPFRFYLSYDVAKSIDGILKTNNTKRWNNTDISKLENDKIENLIINIYENSNKAEGDNNIVVNIKYFNTQSYTKKEYAHSLEANYICNLNTYDNFSYPKLANPKETKHIAGYDLYCFDTLCKCWGKNASFFAINDSLGRLEFRYNVENSNNCIMENLAIRQEFVKDFILFSTKQMNDTLEAENYKNRNTSVKTFSELFPAKEVEITPSTHTITDSQGGICNYTDDLVDN